MSDDLESAFDRWASEYDADVERSGFPFDGYDRVLDRVVALAAIEPGMEILELGPGTGNLTTRLIAAGAAVWAVDFSAEMLAQAKVKAPAAVFAKAGLMDDYPPEFHRPFDRVVSTYTFHELPLADKGTLLRRLSAEYLSPGGHIVIGDIGFPDATALKKMKSAAGAGWEDEYYWVKTDIMPALSGTGFTAVWEQISSCGMIISLKP